MKPAGEICDDGQDNNGDGVIDCIDPLCLADPICAGATSDPQDPNSPATEMNCSDGIDDDSDGEIDCADSDCAQASECIAGGSGGGTTPGGGGSGGLCTSSQSIAGQRLTGLSAVMPFFIFDPLMDANIGCAVKVRLIADIDCQHASALWFELYAPDATETNRIIVPSDQTLCEDNGEDAVIEFIYTRSEGLELINHQASQSEPIGGVVRSSSGISIPINSTTTLMVE